jgi:dTDP-4-amino-4,6-dideoxygalactose transaminase
MLPVTEHDGDLGPWPYSVATPGMNLRLSDLHSALGTVQARRAQESRAERARLAARYHAAFDELPGLRTVPGTRRAHSAHHLFPVVFDPAATGLSKRDLIGLLHERGARCQVHYTPLHRLPAFADVPACLRTGLDTTDAAFPGLVSLPLWRGLPDADQDRVIDVVTEIAYGKHSKGAHDD